MISTTSHAFLGATPRFTRRMPCSSWWPHERHADCCLQSNAMWCPFPGPTWAWRRCGNFDVIFDSHPRVIPALQNARSTTPHAHRVMCSTNKCACASGADGCLRSDCCARFTPFPLPSPPPSRFQVHHVHADDVASAIVAAAGDPAGCASEAFSVVSKQAVTLRGYAEVRRPFDLSTPKGARSLRS